ncbi:MAG TPA: TonB-dependent receptor [Gelidibacter sp.]|uniref:TonB-dependent receptor plug domain-containing protein n=1 Tax=Gelidibacter sp. TaxID=2018083 RepID=UPI002BF2F455|nr:TonB-dependent receptor [Gelidibacter sp.]HXJ99611.1 TonB-dependent receptor [Gelidibacter sp.]
MTSRFLLLLVLISINSTAQEKKDLPEKLEEVVISAQRIETPFSKNSQSIMIITAEDIKLNPATSVAELLQQVAGLDIRQRGTKGMQADLYIRGGGFDQTLVLIDGIKMDDSQTGHHILNATLPFETIERIEIIKGPAARVYGQNAFTGAINIITKKSSPNHLSIGVSGGSYEQLGASVTANSNFENSEHLVHYSRNVSEGYRYNTDYDSQNYFIKSQFNTQKKPIELLASFADRKFGANGFYATPSAIDQYEETQTSLLGVTTRLTKDSWTITPQVYWRRNQDLYLFDRQNPSGYRNLHISNKIGAQINGSYQSEIGITGFGINFDKVFLSSNNLGNHSRTVTTLFLEQRFKLFKERVDVTPGIAMSYYSDFKFHFFPGINAGVQITDHFRAYANMGYTYRIPTYTDLYYSDPTTLGNEDLKPEEAIAEEFGLKFTKSKFNMSLSLFNRDSKNLIDFIKNSEEERFKATNIRKLNTKGVETSVSYAFSTLGYDQNINLGYTFIEDKIKKLDLPYSQYAINSLKHQFVLNYRSQFIKNFSQTVVYKYAVRTAGDDYGVFDVSVNYNRADFEIALAANNIFNAEYTETNLVPMPKGNLMLGLKFKFD